ncbi:twin-arginine translocation signal domain-containing protein [Agarivorans sp. DSG3-1]|uniref:twin-arginine translocation signal domain-containing protein n=1 Tax=Agarivorans sp. DSG3-1 TaxID=3342249 RepID=UPI00398F84F2
MKLTRRKLLQYGTVTAAAVGGGSWLFSHYPLQFTPQAGLRLSAQHQQIFWALIPAFLEGGVAADDKPALQRVLANIDHAFAVLEPHTQAELRQLLDLLQSRGGWLLLSAGASQLSQLTLQQKLQILQQWQQHYLQLLRQAYQGLHELIMAAWYGDPVSWDQLNYQLPAQAKGLLND